MRYHVRRNIMRSGNTVYAASRDVLNKRWSKKLNLLGKKKKTYSELHSVDGYFTNVFNNNKKKKTCPGNLPITIRFTRIVLCIDVPSFIKVQV